ncbi:MAG: hypothetical protein IKX16_09315 [Clostridia bacterium]|nr:hypothetical protein [Clostridia bacterium]
MKKHLKTALASMLTVIMLITTVPLTVFAQIQNETCQANNSIGAPNIPQDAVEYNGHMYCVFDSSFTWDDAKNYCEYIGGYLVCIDDSAENDFVFSIIQPCDKNLYWLGGYQQHFGSFSWSWVSNDRWSYTNWGYEKPDNYNEVEDKLQMYRANYNSNIGGQWNDASNEGAGYHSDFYALTNTGFVCEWDYVNNSNTEHTVCLSNLECIDEGHYTRNEGDSRVYRLDKEPFIGYEPYGPTGTYGYNGTYRYGNTLVGGGESVNNGFEVWIARWNFTPEISYAYRTFKLDGRYSLLRGSIGLVESYNTSDYDVSLYIYGDDSLLSEYCLTPENIDSNEGAIYLDLHLDGTTRVNELKIEMRDNIAVKGGTSFALYDLFLYDDTSYNPDTPVCSFQGEFNYNSAITNQTESYRYYYNSAWFFKDSYEYNHNLVRMSIRSAIAAAYTTDEHIKYLYENELGFVDYEAHYPSPTEDTIGYAIARKNIVKDGKSISVIAVTVRGGGYLAEWADNFRVGNDSIVHHLGFYLSATEVYTGIKNYINTNIEKLNPEIKIWICRYSRAAAVTNLCAKRLDYEGIPNTSIEPRDVFAYCFECPNPTTDSHAGDELYRNIKSFVNPIDLVPLVAFAKGDWGFRRYGVTYYYPSASTRYNYHSYKKNMREEYKDILSYMNGSHDGVSRYTYELKNQANTLNEIVTLLPMLISRYEYSSYLQVAIMNIAKESLGKDKTTPEDLMQFEKDMLEEIQKRHNSLTIKEQLKQLIKESICFAHYPELSVAWLDSLNGLADFKIAYSKVVVTTAMPFLPWPLNNMRTDQPNENTYPLSIEVVDVDGKTVAYFSDSNFEELIDEEGIEYGICAYIDDNDQLCFELPGDSNYRLIITSDIDTEVSVTMSKLTGELHANEKLVSYFDLPLAAGDTCTGIVDNINENESPYILLVNDKEIEPSADLNEGDQIEHLVNVQVDGCGRVYFPGTFVTGEYAKLEVVFNEENFLGWYLDGELLSTAPEYRIMVKDDLFITAKFSTKLGDVNLDGRIDLADTLLIMRYTLELIELEAPCDLDGDMSVSMADTFLSARYALGLI